VPSSYQTNAAGQVRPYTQDAQSFAGGQWRPANGQYPASGSLSAATGSLLGAAGVGQESPMYQQIMAMVQQYQQELAGVNAATEADRSNMLGQINTTYQEGRQQNRQRTEAQIGQAEASARGSVGETLRQAREQLANVGAVAQPFMLANLSGRLQAQARGQVASERERLTNQQGAMDQQQQQLYLNSLLQTYGMTNRQGPDSSMLMAAIQAMAQSGETGGQGGLAGRMQVYGWGAGGGTTLQNDEGQSRYRPTRMRDLLNQ